jgi:hypothetical protein
MRSESVAVSLFDSGRRIVVDMVCQAHNLFEETVLNWTNGFEMLLQELVIEITSNTRDDQLSLFVGHVGLYVCLSCAEVYPAVRVRQDQNTLERGLAGRISSSKIVCSQSM